MLLANLMTAALLAQAQPAPAPAPAAPPAHDPMMMHETDHALPGDSPVFGGVKLEILSPKEGSAVPGPDMEISFKLTGYELAGAQPGPHVHVIIDNQPYQPDYDASKPFKVTGLSPGPHTLRAFPSRPWHESIKAAKSFALVHFFVGPKLSGKGFANWPDPKKPLLTYSRPKGNYAGEDAKKVMVDFYLSNAKLGASDHKVKMIVDGKESMITEWKPQYLEGLADGPHKISLDLLDKKGAPVANVFNHTEREFTINAPVPGTPYPDGGAVPQPPPPPAPPPAPPAHH